MKHIQPGLQPLTVFLEGGIVQDIFWKNGESLVAYDVVDLDGFEFGDEDWLDELRNYYDDLRERWGDDHPLVVSLASHFKEAA